MFGKYTEKYFDANIQSFLVKKIFKKLNYSVRKHYHVTGRSGEVYKFKFLIYNKNQKILYDPIVYPEDAMLNVIKYLDIYSQYKDYIYFCSLPDIHLVLSKYRSETGAFKRETYGMRKYVEAFQTASKILQNFGIHVIPFDMIYSQVDSDIVDGMAIDEFRNLLNEHLSVSSEDIILNNFQPYPVNKRIRIDDLCIFSVESYQIALNKGYNITNFDVSKYDETEILDKTINLINKLVKEGYMVKNLGFETVQITDKGIIRTEIISEPKKTTLNDLRHGVSKYLPTVIDIIYKAINIFKDVKGWFGIL